MKKCLICGASIEEFMSFGKMPIANGFLSPGQFKDEYFFELKTAFCQNCGMFQLLEQPLKEMMFNENYAFFSGTSKRMALHFKEFADEVLDKYIKAKDPFVVEIGSNDGILLQNFSAKNIRHLGIEPSANVAQAASAKGINTVSEFFDEKLARKVCQEHGQADVILAANCMCHIPYLHSVVEGMKLLLKPGGRVIFEDPYLADVLEKTSYDQIYDEHVFLFSLASVKYLFNEHSMELADVKPQETHGGSMRYYIAHKGTHSPGKSVQEQLKKEGDLGLSEPETFEAFRRNCERSKKELISVLNDIKREGKRVVGYAATSKSTTVINYCGIGPDLIEFICDTTPIKQGKFSPGKHIPIKPYEEFVKSYPEYALLFGWNHAKEIMAKEEDFASQGGKWIVYVPKVGIN
ncbi:MAG: class I SAM-dependent methyltransferase [Candidatus Omnitrophota bacterium]